MTNTYLNGFDLLLEELNIDQTLTEAGEIAGTIKPSNLLKADWNIITDGSKIESIDDPNNTIDAIAKYVGNKFPNRRQSAINLANKVISTVNYHMQSKRPSELGQTVKDCLQTCIDVNFDGDPVDNYSRAVNNLRQSTRSRYLPSDREREFFIDMHKAALIGALVDKFFAEAIKQSSRKNSVARALNLDPTDKEFAKEWFKNHVTKIFFTIPRVDSDEYFGDPRIPEDQIEAREDSSEDHKARLEAATNNFFRLYPNAIEGKDFKYRNTSESDDPWKMLWSPAAETTFDTKVGDMPDIIKTIIDNAKRQSLQDVKNVEQMSNDYIVYCYPLAQAILKLFDNDLNFVNNKSQD